MRKVLDLLTWLLVIAAVPAVFRLTTPPDVEAALGIPACAGSPHKSPCRLCSNKGRTKLPAVIDEHNVRFIQTSADLGAGDRGF